MMVIYGKYLYTKSFQKIVAWNYQEILKSFDEMQDFIQYKKGYCVGYISYEAGVIMQIYNNPALIKLYNDILSQQNIPFLYFECFKHRTKISEDFYTIKNPCMLSEINKQDDYEHYAHAFRMIKKFINSGDTYQVNFTQESHFKAMQQCKALDIFITFAQRQTTPYKAYIKNDFMQILSFSPELFFEIKNRAIRVQPMKGTAARGCNKAQDAQNKHNLFNDMKNRSENVMIVDLLRNDLNRIAQKVRVDKLFCLHTYPTLHQMVSDISAKLPKNYTIKEVFAALLPSGSITGAPKIRTIEIIAKLEQRTRGVYCGAIGVLSYKKAIFSIPIRTLIKHKHECFYRYGVGSGIVWDSNLEEEYQEVQLKKSFLIHIKDIKS